ncbi:uncharacterized protein TRIADDRAFT_57757 [Trichoplax adhaerens]|uniref:MARVEL domain-containing protein n=1 Tax=Trichoplax adhaerens TaxID=10228 RepID=B3S0B8_TRIAD|nr:predicted protein [Trichoplax adhaerens]EDV23985.1 predicted protein [Trichoplax adhaerens]|eukprot:XP_002113511.1 predicted protein [Trichoplax adhaerens]
MSTSKSTTDTIVADTMVQGSDDTEKVKAVRGIIRRLQKYWLVGTLLGITHFILGIVAVANPCTFGSHAIGLSEYGTCFWLAGVVTLLSIVGFCIALTRKFTERNIKIHGAMAALGTIMTIVGYVLLGINLTKLLDLKNGQAYIVNSSCTVAVSLIKTSSIIITLGLFIVVTIYLIICGYTLQSYYYTSEDLIKLSKSGLPVQFCLSYVTSMAILSHGSLLKVNSDL